MPIAQLNLYDQPGHGGPAGQCAHPGGERGGHLARLEGTGACDRGRHGPAHHRERHRSQRPQRLLHGGRSAIHFFTGTHEDYHKPGDDAEKLNYAGMLEVARFIESLVTDLSDNGKLAFTKTKEDTAATRVSP